MTHLIFVRHGETDHNVHKRFQGHTDISLNARGVAMAEAARNMLAEVRFSTILTSDLKRAAQTAEIIAQGHQEKVIQDPVLREMNFGDWEGLTYQEIEKQFPQALKAWQEDMNTTPPPNGETLHQFTERIKTLFEDILGGCFTDKVLVVSHGGVLQVMACFSVGTTPF